MPDAKTAFEVTRYERGTITPLGLDLPVVVDERMRGEAITLGSGVHGVAIGLDADDINPSIPDTSSIVMAAATGGAAVEWIACLLNF